VISVRAALVFVSALLVSPAAFAQGTRVPEAPQPAQDKVPLPRGSGEFSGITLVSKGDSFLQRVFGSRIAEADFERELERRISVTSDFRDFKREDVWRWASITKQVTAVLVMQDVAAGRIDLDAPITRYLPGFRGPTGARITVRQLLRHQSGLPNPDETPKGKDGIAGYYLPKWSGSRNPLTGYCAGPVRTEPGGNWSYNNCDYIVVGALLEAVRGKPWAAIINDSISRPLGLKSLKVAAPSDTHMRGYLAKGFEPRIDFSAFGAAGNLFGTARDLLTFDRALITGKLLPEAQRAEMWEGQPNLGFIALGQWAFGAELKGCPAPVRIIERRGAIGGVEVRNFILPDKDIVVIAFTNRAGFDFGEIWQGKGFSYNLLSEAACE
jgi:D-alanyl-D-alanine carboxypeptidase